MPSGVGTAIEIASDAFIRAASVVAMKRPLATCFATSAALMSWMCDSPAFNSATTRSLTSYPMTVKPASANSMASGRPTYPSPTTATTASCDWMRDSSCDLCILQF